MKRRSLLVGLATLIALPFYGTRRSVLAFEALPTDLARVMGYAPNAARVVGSAYLSLAAEEADARVLEQRIWATLGMLRSSCTLSGAGLKEKLAQRIREDFAEGKMVSIQGWMLARTEARLCALASLREGAC